MAKNQPSTDNPGEHGSSLTPEQQVLADRLTNLQRGTVLGVVAGKSQRQAYRDAGGKAKTDEAADTSAYEIMSRPEVAVFYAALVGAVAKTAAITLETLLAELEQARQAALGGEKPQAAAMVAATMGKAKLLGLEAPSKIDHSSTDGTMSPKASVVVSDLTDEQLAKLIAEG